jgi:hypothetical protein
LLDNQKRLRYWEEKLSKLSLQNVSEEGEEYEPEPMPQLSRDELEDLNKESLKAAIAGLEERTSSHVELAVLAEYRRRVEEHTVRLADLNTALVARDAAKKRTDDLRRLRLEGFMEGFSLISMRLKEMYQMITMGGNAELELVDSLDPFAEGILFSVMPPKKSWKNISNLSGGEKTLSSLALVFALHHYKPTPLYVMDEIDAALDFKNVSCARPSDIVIVMLMFFSGLYRCRLHQGTHQERPIHRHFVAQQHVRACLKAGRCIQGQPHGTSENLTLPSLKACTDQYASQTKSVTVENKDYITAR